MDDAEKRWSRTHKKFLESSPKIEAFLDEIEAVCLRHSLSIGHEDAHGSFTIEEYSDDLMGWLRRADDDTPAEVDHE